MGNLFQQVKDTIKGQKSNFCTRSTRVTLLTQDKVGSDEIGYTNCDGVSSGVTFDSVVSNNNYIPDCVRGGSPITSKNGYKYFVQYGTTDCNTPPPSGTNTTLFPCGGLGEGVVVDTTGYKLKQGNVYEMSLNPLDGPTPVRQCYTVGSQTDLQASYNIIGQVTDVGDCAQCRKVTPTPTVTTLLRTYSVQVSSFGSEPEACSSITATTSVYSTEPMAANVTFLYTDQQLTTPYYSNGYVLWIDKGNYVISTGTDGKVLSVTSCI